jgi:UDP-3-O-[3-hydroxymyristoyl] glucosamine N-acyltransferase
VIGEGTKIDNLVQIGHNVRTGRHCIFAGQAGLAGSAELGDFVILGGQAAVADHVTLGDGARAAGQTGFAPGTYPGGRDYGGTPARTAMDWKRENATLAKLIRPKRPKE